MGLNARLAIMMSGIATICFLLIVNGRVPSYLGTSASFVGGVAAIQALARRHPHQTVTGAILIAGLILALVGLAIPLPRLRRAAGAAPVVTGAVVVLIGFNLPRPSWPISTGPRTSGWRCSS